MTDEARRGRTETGATHALLGALPPGFVLGTTSSAPQSEAVADRVGESIWDVFAHQPGATLDGTASVGHRTPDVDVALLADLGADTHRLSVSWPRVQPRGRGPVDASALDHYDRYVDRLLAAGVEPVVTLYTWDLPRDLEEDGGWLNPATVEHFTAYATLVAERLADRVAHWIPIDGPAEHAMLGHGIGYHAPGKQLGFNALWVHHHLLLAHGRAVIALRQAGARSVGCANHHAPIWPSSESDADVGAGKLFDAMYNGSQIEPMLLGRYPADLQPLLEPIIQPGDLPTIRQPLDFYGINYHRPLRVAAAPPDADLPWLVGDVLGHPLTGSGRPIVPDALREWLVMFRARFRAALPPLVITELGCSAPADPAAPEDLGDQDRIDYLTAHLAAVGQAVARGVDVRGLHVRSLLDGWEWRSGLTECFGLVHLDHETQQATPRDSFGWFRDLLAQQHAREPDEEIDREIDTVDGAEGV